MGEERTRDMRPKWIRRADGLQRFLMWRYLSGRLPLYLITEYPRSGGSWVGQMLSAYLDIPFPRNEFPPLKTCILHGHHLYHRRFHNVFFVLRDGRDVMVSLYYHTLFHNDRNSPYHVEEYRSKFDFDDFHDVQSNLPIFIDFMFTEYTRPQFHHRWDKLVLSWYRRNTPVIRYESLLEDAVAELTPPLEAVLGEPVDRPRLTAAVDRFSFENLTKRKRGEEQTRGFIRKGVAGDWRNKFSSEARQVFDHHAGAALIETGYEEDRSWVEADSSARRGVTRDAD